MNTSPLIPIHYIAQVSEYLKECAIDSEAWLGRFDLSEQSLLDPSLLIEFKKYQQLVLSAVRLSKNPGIGLRIGKKLPVNSHGILGYALLNCVTLRQAIEMCQRYVGIRSPLVELTLFDDTQQAYIEITERLNFESIRMVYIESLLVSVSQSLSSVVGEHTLIKKIEVNFAEPSYAQEYQAMFACEVCFNQTKSRIFLDTAWLDKPLTGRDPSSFKQAESLCKLELEKVKSNRQLAGQVYTLLLISEPEKRTLDGIAKKLFISPRTLHRHLLAQGTHFKVLLEQVNSELAKGLLLNGQSVHSVALQLGYADSANFRRAFKRWNNMTPQDFVIKTNSSLKG